MKENEMERRQIRKSLAFVISHQEPNFYLEKMMQILLQIVCAFWIACFIPLIKYGYF
jgi:hypothetical protein